MAHGPYGKGMAFYDGHFKVVWDMMTAAYPETAAASSNRYQAWEMVDPERWVRDGYACVRVDSRGSGRSPGVIDPFSPRETRDYYNCIEWAGVQEWSSGKVGLCGISYYAMNQWLVASLKPPHLAAMFAFEGAADCYRDTSRQGGILTTFWRFLIDSQILTIQNGVGVRGYRSKVTGDLVSGPATFTTEHLASNYRDMFAAQKSNELDGQFYRERSPDWSKVEVPFCSAGSWGGLCAAPARQHRGIHRGRIQGQVSGDARPGALDALLHQLRLWSSEAFLRLLPEGQGGGLEERAPRAAAGPSPDESLRRAG